MRVENKPSVTPTKEKDPDSKPKKSFSAALEKDRQAREEPVLTAGVQAQPNPMAIAGPESLEGASSVDTVRALADEIVAVVGPNGLQQLEVEVDSKVLGDLRISVSREVGGDLSIRLMTDSSQMAALLQQNVGQLSAALAARNVPAVAIQVSPRVASSGAADRSRRDRDKRDRDRR